jgi:PBSX family phage portal protein
MTDQQIVIRYSDEIETENIFAQQDPFNKSWDEIKDMRGLSTNFKRRTTRAENKVEKAISNIPTNRMGQVVGQYADAAGVRASGIDGIKSKQINPGEVFRNGYGVFDVITPPYNLYELANFYDTNFANHAAIDAKTANTVGLGYYFDTAPDVVMRMENMENESAMMKAKRRLDRLKGEAMEWLESLNDEDSFLTIMEKIYTDMESTGNGYMEIGRTVAGDIGYIGHIPSTTMRVRRIRDGFSQIVGGQIVYFRNFGATNPNPITDDPRPNEVIHFKAYSPLNTFYGVPDIISAYLSLKGDQLASQFNIDYFENKAVPRYIVVVKGARLDRESEDRLFRFLQTGLKGQNHRTLYVPLPADQEGNKIEFDMMPVEANVQEASFDKYHHTNRDDILMAHQVPLSKLGGVDAGGLAAALAQDRTFKEQVTRPAQRYIEKMVNKIVKTKTDLISLKFKELTLTDEVAQSQILERYVKTQIMTPDEAREKIGLPSRPDGDGSSPLVLNPRQAADARANLAGNRQRDAERQANNSDSVATTTGRNPQGEGRRVQ